MESSAAYRTLQQGEMLNWYRIERILGRGGFGVIYLATDTNLDHQVAIKEYIPSDIAKRDSDSKVYPLTEEHGDMYRWGLDRFIKEARNLVKFKHPNIVRVMSIFQENNTAYMVMEFEEGEELRSYLSKPGGLSEAELKKLIVPISEGLAEVHRLSFIHRDIKPANILVRKNGSPVLLDFGSARNASTATKNGLTALVSVGYAPLEQYNPESEEQQGPWTDIYALGGVLYFAVSGKDPMDSTRRGSALFNGGKDPLIPAVYLGADRYSEPFLNAIDWAMQFRIADRPQTLSDWIPALLSESTPQDASITTKELIDKQRIRSQREYKGDPQQLLGDYSDATRLSQRSNRDVVDATLAMPQFRETTGPGTARSVAVRPRLMRLASYAIAALAVIVGAGIWLFQQDDSSNEPITTTGVEAGATASEQLAAEEKQRELEAELANRQAAEQARQVAEAKAAEAIAEKEARLAAEAVEAEKAQQAAEAKAADDARKAAEAKAADDARRAAEAKAADDVRKAAEAKAADDARKAAEAKAADDARKAAEAKAADDARKAAEAKAVDDARKAEEAAAAKEARQEAARQARLAEERAKAEAAAKKAADNALRIKLNNAADAAARALNDDQLAEAARQLAIAESTGLSSNRLDDLSKLINDAIDLQNRPISQDDFNDAVSLFVRLKRSIEANDFQAVRSLANAGPKPDLLADLSNRYEKLTLQILDIKQRNAEKSISATLRITGMIRSNGDRATPADSYRDRQIKVTRVRGKWGKISWP